MNALNHPDFIKRLKSNDESAYQELDSQLFPWFRNFLIKKYNIDFEDSKDIVQDVAKRIVEKIDQFHSETGNFIPWTFQILRNITIDWLRNNKKLEFVRFQDVSHDAISDDTKNQEKADDLSPLERLPDEVREAFFRLNDRYQQFLGILLTGTPEEHIMKIFNLDDKGAFYTLKSRALRKLKIEVEKILEDEL